MKILALTKYFPPDIGTASHLFFELCETLVRRGHEVTAVTSLPRYNLKKIPAKYRNRLFLKEEMNGITVLRVAGIPSPRPEISRSIEQFYMALPLYFCGLAAQKPEAIIVYSPPIALGITGYLLGKKWHVPFIVNIQDLFPQCCVDYGFPKIIIKSFGKIADFVYHKVNYITVHSVGNREVILRDSPFVSPEKIKVIDNWVDTDFIKPGKRTNTFSALHNLNGHFVVSFAGSIGIPQGLEVVIAAANELRDLPEILFLIVGDGVMREKIVRKASGLDLTNVQFLPMQPRGTYPWILASSEVCLVTLLKEISTPVIPSKILSIMAAGRPVLASMPLHGDAPKLIAEADCGLCVEPGNAEALAAGILKLYHNPELRELYGRNGRRYVEEHLSREACVANYETIFQQAVKNFSSSGNRRAGAR